MKKKTRKNITALIYDLNAKLETWKRSKKLEDAKAVYVCCDNLLQYDNLSAIGLIVFNAVYDEENLDEEK